MLIFVITVICILILIITTDINLHINELTFHITFISQ